MTGNAALRARGGPAPIAQTSDRLTHVELTWIEKRIENWIRFGQEVRDEVLDRRRRVFSYRPGSVFAFVRWAANDFGTTSSRIDIVLKIEGWPKVEQVLRHIDAVEAIGILPHDVAPDHWRHVANRMSTGQEPRAYTRERHQAWLKRREIER